jgi:hypothetical protein
VGAVDVKIINADLSTGALVLLAGDGDAVEVDGESSLTRVVVTGADGQRHTVVTGEIYPLGPIEHRVTAHEDDEGGCAVVILWSRDEAAIRRPALTTGRK